jgi:hypothetical protein
MTAVACAARDKEPLLLVRIANYNKDILNFAIRICQN